MSITPQSAVSLANWLQFEHPALFQMILQQVAPGLAGLGDDLPDLSDSTVTVSAPDLSVSAPDLTPIDTGSLISPSIDNNSLVTSLPTVAEPTSSSSAWSTIASGVSSAVGAVGSFLSSSQGINSLTNLATAYYKSQAQAPIIATLQTQAARAQAGQTVAPISYVQGANGQVIPVYASTLPPATVAATGNVVTTAYGTPAYTLTPQSLQSLAPSALTQLKPYLPYLLLGGLGLLLLSS